MVLRFSFILFALLVNPLSFASEYTEGKDFHYVFPLFPKVSSNQHSAIEVVEFFWYGCPHCAKFEPYLTEWKKNKPENVELITIPATLTRLPTWLKHSQLHYTLEVLGLDGVLRHKVFDSIHKIGNELNTREKMRDFVLLHNVSTKEFNLAYKSKRVYRQIKKARDLTRIAGITGVPTIIIDGRYMVEPSKLENYKTAINLINWLIDKAEVTNNGQQFNSLSNAKISNDQTQQ